MQPLVSCGVLPAWIRMPERPGTAINRPLSGSPLIRERVITIGEWWFESVAVPPVVTKDMQRAERAVGQVLQADEFESHIFPGQQFFLFGSTINNHYQQFFRSLSRDYCGS